MRFPSIAALVAAALLLPGVACKRHDRVRLEQTDEQAAPLASIVHVADPRNASQLLTGFYDIEQNSWRWTAGRFSVLLRPPRGAAQKGAVLELKFSIPDTILSKLKTVSLSAAVNGSSLAPQSYNQSGEFTYSREVAPNLLGGESVKVDFSLDKALPPTGTDQRELGLVVSTVGLASK